MRKIPAKIETVVFKPKDAKKRGQKEKIWIVAYLPVRRHSRSLYVPLPYEVILLHNIKKGDIVKVTLHSVRHAPGEEAPLQDPGAL